MAYTKQDIISLASIYGSKGPVTSTINQGNYVSTLNDLYDVVYGEIIANDDFRFATKLLAANKVSGETSVLSEWTILYAFPADALVLTTIYPAGSDYEIYGNRIYSNTDNLIIEYRYKPSESLITDSFAAYFASKLAFDALTALAVSPSQIKFVESILSMKKAVAISVDNRNAPVRNIQSNPFIEFR